jgi:hypothetical protein
VAQLEVLIFELVAIDRLSAGSCISELELDSEQRNPRTIAIGEIATLDHKVLDDPVER